jgi:hypothetical protein
MLEINLWVGLLISGAGLYAIAREYITEWPRLLGGRNDDP